MLEKQSSSSFHNMIHSMTKNFTSPSHSSLLVLLQNSLDFFQNNCSSELDHAKDIFRAMILRGNRNEIRSLHQITKPGFGSERFEGLRRSLYSTAKESLQEPAKKGKIPGVSKFSLLCDIISDLLVIETTAPIFHLISPLFEKIVDQSQGNQLDSHLFHSFQAIYLHPIL